MLLYEIIITLFAILLNLFLYKKSTTNKFSRVEMTFLGLASLLIVFISIYMVSDTITVDEMQYMNVISNMHHILDDPAVAYKLMLQYRTSQMFFGTLFSLIPRNIFGDLSHTTLIIIYKMIHWITFYIVGIAIVYVMQRQYIKQSKESWKNVMAWMMSFYLIFGIPMTISVMKVCNYDASNVMLGTLAILLVGKEVIALTRGGGISRNNFLYGKIGLLLSILGCLDKFSSGIYFIVCAVLYVFAKIYRENCGKVIKAFFESVKIIICALCIGYINLNYICFALAGGRLYEPIKFGHVAFSFTYIFQVVFEGMELAIGNKALYYIILLPFLISFLALLLYLVKTVFVKIRYSCKIITFINKLSAIILGLMILIGIYGTYYVPQMLSPYAPVEIGEFSSIVVWGTYHYGAYSWVGHKLSQIAYAFATVMSNYPTSVLLLFLVYIYVVLRKDIEEFCCQIVVLGSVLLIAILACMNQPSDPRYFGVSILLLVICTWIVIYNNQILMLYEKKKKRYKTVIGLLVVVCIGFIELAMYVPNVKIFAPLWNYRSTQWKETIRPGQWDAGEAMSWGEELALAGRKINKLRQEDGLVEDTITIYSDYGTYWLLNPGYSILPISQAGSSVQLNEATYFVFTKKRLFRMMELPPFLYEVEPIDTVEYRGEICSWIYKGSQLKEYQSYFAVD